MKVKNKNILLVVHVAQRYVVKGGLIEREVINFYFTFRGGGVIT